MKKLTLEDIKRLARLSNLQISDDEAEKYPDQLTESLQYVENLQDIPTSSDPDTFFVTQKTNTMAEDEVDESIMLSQKEALKNAKNTRDGYFIVKRIL